MDHEHTYTIPVEFSVNGYPAERAINAPYFVITALNCTKLMCPCGAEIERNPNKFHGTKEQYEATGGY